VPGKRKAALQIVALNCHDRNDLVTYLWPSIFNNVSRLSYS
jgi:hypothetical protein